MRAATLVDPRAEGRAWSVDYNHASITVMKAIAAMGAILMAVWKMPPESVRTAVDAVVIVVLGDTITGLWAARIMREATSERMRMKFYSKMTQYVTLGFAASGLALMTNNWNVVHGCLLIIFSCEGFSMLENLLKLQKYGVQLGPIAPAISKFSEFLGVGTPAVIAQPAKLMDLEAPVVTSTIAVVQETTIEHVERK